MRILSKLLPASKRMLVISSIGIVALLAFASVILFHATQKEIVLAENGKDRKIDTHADTVLELLDEVGIEVGEHDVLSHDESEEIADGMKIEYKKANKIVVSIDGKEKMYYTVADTVGDFLAEQELTVSEHDSLSHQKKEKIKDGLSLSITQAFELTINDGGKEVKAWSTGGSVEDVLQSSSITLTELDKIKPALDESVTKDTSISIIRIEKKKEEVTETVEYQTETRKDSSLEKGKEKVIAAGEEGTVVKTYEVTYENGKPVKREVLKKDVTKESKNRILAVGTKEPQNLVTLSSGSGKEFTMTASAFTAYCNGCSGYTATGINLKANPNVKVIAVDPNVIPLGTRVWVEGYGEAVAGDTGGHIRGNRIDIHVPSKADAYSWGVRKVKVKIID
ncbi:G5 and 3D domain-containing protein [Ornithinibacillus scapharcae]|uniref:G5 and 3D domain-containing protein n=1 Tax=Ornithinibacillus scapharcae TaxID=1147159 RepID=UPI000225AD96|nr:G5 and 3D domain-containing protein [Ornithinibacillus scapharcae]